jgi:sugar lactone lactonase YvrE
MSPLRILSAVALLMLAFPALSRADHIQSFQLPENVIGQTQFNIHTVGCTASSINSPVGVAVDPITGKVFISDSNNNRVLRFSSASALLSGAAAEAVLGQPDFTSNGHATTPKELYAPAGLAFDSTGRLWVADSRNHRILRFDNASAKPQFAGTADGVLGQTNFSTAANPNPPDATSMNQPFGVAVDTNGTLWVSDSWNYRVLRFDNAAAKANGAAADGVLGVPVFTVNSGGLTNQYAFNIPRGLAVDSAGHLWVADGANHRVLRFDNAAVKTNGALADGLLGQSDFTTAIPYSPPTATTMSFASGVVVDGSGTLWVADAGNQRVLRFDNAASKANDAAPDAVLGQKSFTTNFSALSRAGMFGPIAVALTTTGDLFVAEANNDRVTRFTSKPDPATPTPMPAPSHVAPTLAVSGKKLFHTTHATATISGQAASADGIAAVTWKLGSGSQKSAIGTSAWHFKASLKPGKNTITITATSNAQLTSAPVVVRIIRDQP